MEWDEEGIAKVNAVLDASAAVSEPLWCGLQKVTFCGPLRN